MNQSLPRTTALPFIDMTAPTRAFAKQSSETRTEVEDIDPSLFAPNAATARPELLVSAVLHLMSHYTASRQETGACIKLASVIERHLKVLADLQNLAPVLRATCLQLSEQWAGVVDQALSKPKKHGLMTRLLVSRQA